MLIRGRVMSRKNIIGIRKQQHCLYMAVTDRLTGKEQIVAIQGIQTKKASALPQLILVITAAPDVAHKPTAQQLLGCHTSLAAAYKQGGWHLHCPSRKDGDACFKYRIKQH